MRGRTTTSRGDATARTLTVPMGAFSSSTTALSIPEEGSTLSGIAMDASSEMTVASHDCVPARTTTLRATMSSGEARTRRLIRRESHTGTGGHHLTLHANLHPVGQPRVVVRVRPRGVRACDLSEPRRAARVSTRRCRRWTGPARPSPPSPPRRSRSIAARRSQTSPALVSYACTVKRSSAEGKTPATRMNPRDGSMFHSFAATTCVTPRGARSISGSTSTGRPLIKLTLWWLLEEGSTRAASRVRRTSRSTSSSGGRRRMESRMKRLHPNVPRDGPPRPHRRRGVGPGACSTDRSLERGVGGAFLLPRRGGGDRGGAHPLVPHEHGDSVAAADRALVALVPTRGRVRGPGERIFNRILSPSTTSTLVSLTPGRGTSIIPCRVQTLTVPPFTLVLAVHLDEDAVGVAPRGFAASFDKPNRFVPERRVQRSLPVCLDLVQEFDGDGGGGTLAHARDHDGVLVRRGDEHPLVGLRRRTCTTPAGDTPPAARRRRRSARCPATRPHERRWLAR